MKRPVQLLAFSVLISLSGCGGGGGSTHNGTPGPITGQVFATGLSAPMMYAANPTLTDTAYVLLRDGVIKVLVSDSVQPANVLDISNIVDTSGEGGLQGIAFDPQFAANRFFYINYTSKSPMTTRVVRYTMSVDGRTAGSPTAIFSYDQSPFTNHKGGALNFGLDGLLYLGLGDGGSENDPNNRSQDPTVLFGKILRIDPTSDDFPGDPDNNYHIPASNPFVGTAGVRGEIWDAGVRNPFRWSIDKLNGAIIIGDVGQDAWEEIDYEPAGSGGRNFGWRIREGDNSTGLGGTPFSGTLTDPFLEIPHPSANAIVGGFIYRGTDLTSLHNKYLFGDYVHNKLWSVTIPLSGSEATQVSFSSAIDISAVLNQTLTPNLNGPVSIDQDTNGQPVIVELNGGRLIRLIPTR